MDVSSLREVEACGGAFRRNGKEGDAMAILRDCGMNLVRLRLWNDPFDETGVPYGGGVCDMKTVKRLAGRANALGVPWALVFQYSDFWADPGKQTVPKAWRELGADGLEQALYRYTRDTLESLVGDSIPPSVVSVGNETTNGLLWPYGKYPRFDNIARFLNAGIQAVRETLPDALVMVHLDNGGNHAVLQDWLEKYFESGGADFDILGLSYYPFWHGKGMDDLRKSLNQLARKYRKPLLLTETSMGFTTEDYGGREKLSPAQRKGMAAKPALAKHLPWSMTPEGQRSYLRDLFAAIRQVPDGLGKGFVWWEPAWLPVCGSQWATEAGLRYIGDPGPGGNEWANQALFDYDGNALPALEILKELS